MASKNIRGITIEIGGDTGPLGKALQEVNKKSRELETELKEVNKLLKLDPGNTVLVAQKQKLLAESVTNTKGKLETLKEAEKQAQAQFKKGDISEEQYRALQREVVSTETKLKSLEAQGRQTNAVLSKDEAIGNLKNIGKAAGAAALAAGAAIGAMVFKVVENADELQRQADVTGLSAERLQELQYIGNNLGVDLDTITGAQSKLTKAMNAGKDGTGAQAEAFAKLGVSIVDSDGNLRDSKVVMGEAFDALGKVGNETERDALAMQIFGKSGMELNPIIKAGGDELNRLSDEAKANGSVMSNEAVAGLDSFGDTIDNLKSSVLGAFGEKFAELLPTIQGFLDKLKELPSWIDQNKTTLTLLGVAFGTITALVIAFNIQQALMASGMTLWGVVAGVGTGITTGLGVAFAFLTSPIGLVILAIGVVIAIGVLMYKNWDTVKLKATELWSSITGTFENIKTGISGKVEAIKTSISNVFGKIKDVMSSPFETARDTIKGVIDKIKGFLDFKWSWPTLKMPHFSIKNASLNPVNWITNGMPKLSVDWYDKGGIFNSPNIIGVGEKRPEFVGALDDLREIVRSEFNKSGGMTHSGTIKVEGVDSKGQLMSVVDIVMDQLRKDVRS